MALVNLQTDLKSLKFGKDKPAGGSSNQPYIQTPIPDGDLPVKSPDFLLRNGVLAPISAAKDASRLTQMFFDTKSPRGLLFITKQELLSRISVKTQASKGPAYAMGALNQGVYLPTSTIAQSLVGFTGTHLNLLGLDPTSPMAGVAEKGLLEWLGLPGLGLKTYEEVMKNQQFPDLGILPTQNRLEELKDVKIQQKPSGLSSLSVDKSLKETLELIGEEMVEKGKQSIKGKITGNNISPNPTEILAYGGGPGSVVGIGGTQIKFADGQRTGLDSNLYIREKSFFTPNQKYKTDDPLQKDFRKEILETRNKDKKLKSSTIMGIAPSYKPGEGKTIEGLKTSRINYTSPGQKGNVYNYTDGKKKDGKLIGPVDRINALPIYQSENVEVDPVVNDLVKFRIAAINNTDPIKKDYIHFRAYIDSFSDNYSSNWDSINYMGRGESFWKYGSFKRGISLSFTVAAQSKQELIPMYKKLNFLASNLAPTYSDEGYMAGSLVTLTLGGWCWELPGFITSMTLDAPQESPWEIAIDTEGKYDKTVKEMPHIVKVTGFSFTPIEEFRPAKQDNTYGKLNTELKDHNTYGPERYIALKTGKDETNTNYKKLPPPPPPPTELLPSPDLSPQGDFPSSG